MVCWTYFCLAKNILNLRCVVTLTLSILDESESYAHYTYECTNVQWNTRAVAKNWLCLCQEFHKKRIPIYKTWIPYVASCDHYSKEELSRSIKNNLCDTVVCVVLVFFFLNSNLFLLQLCWQLHRAHTIRWCCALVAVRCRNTES